MEKFNKMILVHGIASVFNTNHVSTGTNLLHFEQDIKHKEFQKIM